MKKQTIAIDEWHKLVKEGAEIPVSFYLQGNSMAPLLRVRKDKVTVVPLRREPLPGDIVLFWDEARGEKRYVVHRVREVRKDTVITIGDNCVHDDAPLPKDHVLGLVAFAERNGKRLELDTDESRRRGLEHIRRLPLRRATSLPARRFAGRCFRFAVRCFRFADRKKGHEIKR